MAQKYEKIVQEDLNIGTEAVWVTAPGSGKIRSTQVGLHSVARGQQQYQAAWTPGAITAGSYVSTTVTVPDAALGDFVLASHDKIITSPMRITGHISAAGIATVIIHNPTSASVTVAAGTVSVLVFPAIGVSIDSDVANVTGTVTYDGGTLWAGATVTMTLDGTPWGVDATTNGSGVYTFANVTVGAVVVSCTGDPGPGPRLGSNSGDHTPPTDTTLNIACSGA